MVFDLSKPALRAVRSSFGGGWLFPITDEGRRVVTEYFQEGPAPLAPFGGEEGWIIEPQDAGDLAEYLRSEGIAWEIG